MPRSPDWLFVSVWRAPVDTSPDAELLIDKYLVWAYVTAVGLLPPQISSFSQEQLRDLTLDRTARWNQHLHQLIAQCDLKSVSLVPLKNMPHLREWQTTRVTVMGDSIHNMTPMAGIGANTALRDARLLSRALVAVKVDLVSALRDYEQQMRKYANPALALSLGNARNAGKSP